MDLKRKRIMNIIATAICIIIFMLATSISQQILINSPEIEMSSTIIRNTGLFTLVVATAIQALIMWLFYNNLVHCEVSVGKCFKCMYAAAAATYLITVAVGFVEAIIISRSMDIRSAFTPIIIINYIIRAIIYLVATGSIGMTAEEKEEIQRQQEEYKNNHQN